MNAPHRLLLKLSPVESMAKTKSKQVGGPSASPRRLSTSGWFGVPGAEVSHLEGGSGGIGVAIFFRVCQKDVSLMWLV